MFRHLEDFLWGCIALSYFEYMVGARVRYNVTYNDQLSQNTPRSFQYSHIFT